MIDVVGKACTGCEACAQICPKKCISMEPNSEGFLYPIVAESCISCGLCQKICPQLREFEGSTAKAFYGFKNKDKDAIFRSASGGISDLATKAILDRGGVAFGAGYTDSMEVKHIAITRDSEREKIQSSKYVQSVIGDSFHKAKEYLDTGRAVLFTGTPCQIGGLYTYLGKKYDKLYTIDLICHGVPSPLLFQKYIAYCGKKMRGKVLEYNFRSKEKRGWGTQYLIKTKTKTKTKTLVLDKYGRHFMAGDCYRESCYQCQYTGTNKRPADITIGDFWGVYRAHPEFGSSQGVSSVMINTDKGQELFDIIATFADVIPITEEEINVQQGNLKHPTHRPKERDTFYKGIDGDEFIARLKVGAQCTERIKSLIPYKLQVALKKRVH